MMGKSIFHNNNSNVSQQNYFSIKKVHYTSESSSSAPNCSLSLLTWAFFGLSSDKNRRMSGLERNKQLIVEAI